MNARFATAYAAMLALGRELAPRRWKSRGRVLARTQTRESARRLRQIQKGMLVFHHREQAEDAREALR